MREVRRFSSMGGLVSPLTESAWFPHHQTMMRRQHLHAPSIVVALVASFVSAPSDAATKGDRCKIKAPLPMLLRGPNGSVEATVEQGTVVELLSDGDGGRAVLRAEDMLGTVSMLDFESACRGTFEQCSAQTAMVIYEEKRRDSPSRKVRAGTVINILERGKAWTTVRHVDEMGYVTNAVLAEQCSKGPAVTSDEDDPTPNDAEGEVADITEDIPRGDGPGVLFLPFHAEGSATLRDADVYGETLYARLSYYRPDAGHASDVGRKRRISMTDMVAEAAKRAKNAEMAYAVIGRLDMAAAPDAPAGSSPDRAVVQVALVDAQSGKVMKAVKARPADKRENKWAELLLYNMLPFLAPAPGARPSEYTKPEQVPDGSAAKPGGGSAGRP